MPFRGVIPAPSVADAPFGLFSAADVKERGPQDEHWGQGFAAMSEACAFNASLIDICAAVEPAQVYVADGDRFVTVRPFGIVAQDECLALGVNAEDGKARVTRQLEVVTQKAVESELWSGVYRSGYDTELAGDAVPLGYLSHADTQVVEAAAQKAIVALALLEQGYADCSPGLRPTIHVSPLVAEVLGDHLAEDGGKLYTNIGSVVAVGSGYDGRGPGETAPPGPFVHWMYATGGVHVVLGSKEMVTVNETQAVNARTNEVTWVAERPAAVYTDGCCQLAAMVDIRL